MSIHFTNTATRRREAFEPLEPGKVRMYTCGPTVYDYAHIGNFRAMVVYDLVKRWLQVNGYDVHHVMNITDVEDKTIRGAHAKGVALGEFTQFYESAFFEDCAHLRLEPPDVTPHATEHIPEMIALIGVLIEKKYAYQAGDGSVYFSISAYEPYGRLSHLDRREVQAGARVAQDEYDKEHASDFVLWKAWTEADGDVKWDSPWGPGRPGWHIECSVMARKYLGDTLDLHMGGEDLVFPHHENEIAQSEAATGKPFVRYWIHNAYLLVDGHKMSKSLGNFHTLRDIMAKGFTGREIRYLLLSTHYRQPFNFTFDGLHAARNALQRLDDLRGELARRANEDGAPSADMVAAIETARTQWSQALDDDLNMSPALAALFELVREANRHVQAGDLTSADARAVLVFLDEIDAVLDIAPGDESVPDEVERLVAARTEARARQDWARSDAIRDELAALGYSVEDTSAGPRVKRI